MMANDKSISDDPKDPVTNPDARDTEDIGIDSSFDEIALSSQDVVDLINRVKAASPEALADIVDSVDSVPPLNQPDPGNDESPATTAAELPSEFGRFQIVRELGHGSFGIVYLATDPKLDRNVALKLPRIEALVNPNVRERFLREAQAIARLHHPQIATVYESGTIEPVCYLASAYYQGGTLADLDSARQPLSHKSAATIVRAVAQGMQHAHSRGILHRDLKPANVLLDTGSPGKSQLLISDSSRLEELGVAIKITDFGLAKFVDEESNEATRTGALIGSPAYMAPELAASRWADVGTATDVYAMGAILYELLTGQPPHREESIAATLRAVEEEDPVRPVSRRADVPRDLEAICLKCLEKDPAKRYATAAELAEDLGNWLEHRPVTARPVSNRERLTRWCRRNPALAALGSTVTLAIVAIALVSTFAYLHVADARRSENEEAAARLEQQKRRETNFQRAREAVDALLTEVSTIALEDQPRMEGVRKALLEKALVFYQAFLDDQGNDPILQLEAAQTHQSMGYIDQLLGNPSAAEKHYLRSLELCEQLNSRIERLPNIKTTWAKGLEGLAGLYLLRGVPAQTDSALSLLEQAQVINESSETANPIAAARCRLLLATHLRRQRQHQKSSEQAEQALTILSELGELSKEDDLARRNQQSSLRALLGHNLAFAEPERAGKHFEAARDIARELHQDYPHRVGYTSSLALRWHELARFYYGREDYPAALRSCESALQMLEQIRLDFPSTPKYRYSLAQSHLDLGSIHEHYRDYDQANEQYGAATIHLAALAEQYPEQFDYAFGECEARYRQVKTLLMLRKIEEARQQASAADKRLVDLPIPEQRSVSVRLQAILAFEFAAKAANLLRQKAEAVKRFESALKVISNVKEDEQEKTDPYFLRLEARIRTAFGSQLHNERKTEAAEEQLRKSLDVFVTLHERFPNNTFYERLLTAAYMNVGNTLMMKRDLTEARRYYQQALKRVEDWSFQGGTANLEREIAADLHYGLAGIYQARRQLSEAAKSYELAMKHEAASDEKLRETSAGRYQRVRIQGNFASVLTSLGQHDRALQIRNSEWKTISQLYNEIPEHPLYRRSAQVSAGNLAFLLLWHPQSDKRDPQRAAELSEKAVAIPGASRQAWATLGFAQYRCAEYKKALPALRKATSAGTPDPLAFYFLAMTLKKLEQNDEAKDWYQRANKLTPSAAAGILAEAQSDARSVFER